MHGLWFLGQVLGIRSFMGCTSTFLFERNLEEVCEKECIMEHVLGAGIIQNSFARAEIGAGHERWKSNKGQQVEKNVKARHGIRGVLTKVLRSEGV